MKIAILTFYWANDNYGQVLQCYALQKFLRDAGHDAYVIRYDPRNDIVPLRAPFLHKIKKALNPRKVIEYVKGQRRIRMARNEAYSHPRRFDEFRRNNITFTDKEYHSYQELRGDPPEADLYIVGSDQVWNFNGMDLARVDNRIRAYFLDFGGERTKRMSYAASFGSSHIDEQLAGKISPLLRNFCHVSVRETSGLEICSRMGIKDVSVDPDPTLLLDADVYRQMYKKEALNLSNWKEKRYILLYLLSNECILDIAQLESWADCKHLEIAYVSGSSSGRRIRAHKHFYQVYPSIEQWLFLVDNADCVITNSFHGSIFAAIFGKKFLTIPLVGRFEPMNTRLSTLFDQLGIAPRFLAGNDFSAIENSYEVDAREGNGSILTGLDRVANTAFPKT